MNGQQEAVTRIKDRAAETITACTQGLVGLSHRIHAHPEQGFSEHLASRWLAEALGAAGFEVEHPAYGMETAVEGVCGAGPLEVVFCAEYDALPEFGHACGHNIIAAAALGAGIGLAPLADELGLRVRVLGTPAEEGGGGKIELLRAGAFEGAAAVMLVHPAPVEAGSILPTAVSQWRVSYTGTAAHAGGAPQDGVNAADAMTVANVAIGLLRQHILPTDRISGVVDVAGEAPNVIPARSAGRWVLRSEDRARLHELEAKVRACFEAGATATGCSLRLEPSGPSYDDLRSDPALQRSYEANLSALGRDVVPGAEAMLGGVATDLGNVSHVVPAIHPLLRIESLPAMNHQPEFAAACVSESADRAIIDGATAMAWTAVDLALASRDELGR